VITGLDHVVIAVADLESAARRYETLLGRSVSWRAEVVGGGACVAAFGLANVAVELIAPKGEGGLADRLRAQLDKNGEGLASLAFKVDDIAGVHRRLERLGLAPEEIIAAKSVDSISGATRAWKRTRASTEKTHGVRLFFMQQPAPPPSPATAEAPVAGLDHVVINTPDPERAAALYGARLGLDMRLDRSNSAWGSRLMFFRCGDLVVEIAHNLKAGVSDGPDRLWGLSWRVGDPDAAQARLAAGGFNVSEVRVGRRPGTRVFTVRDKTCGVPTLFLSAQPHAAAA
jgi:catechol 2,3-dioxygenase-like lactoylglutathione lyase family enzyme